MRKPRRFVVNASLVTVAAGALALGGCASNNPDAGIGKDEAPASQPSQESTGDSAGGSPESSQPADGANENTGREGADQQHPSEVPSDSPGFSAVSGSKDSFLVPDDAPLPPGTALDISPEEPTPGDYFNFQVCSAAYSFSLPDGRQYAVTASHCGKEGEKVWAGQQDRQFRYPAEPIGRVVYSDLYAADSHGLDVALIELDNPGQDDYYTPSYADTAVAESLKSLPDEVCKLGRSTDITCGNVTNDKQKGTLNTKDEKLESTSARARICAKTGDSGGPVYTERDGRRIIVGIVSGTTEKLGDEEECTADNDMGLSFTPIVDVQRIIEDQLGKPAGRVVEAEA